MGNTRDRAEMGIREREGEGRVSERVLEREEKRGVEKNGTGRSARKGKGGYEWGIRSRERAPVKGGDGSDREEGPGMNYWERKWKRGIVSKSEGELLGKSKEWMKRELRKRKTARKGRRQRNCRMAGEGLLGEKEKKEWG